MASFTERLRLIFDFDGSQADRGVKSIRKSVQEADGAWGKFRVAARGALAEINQRASAFAVGAGAALIAWAVRGAQKFQGMAKAALDLGKATGLSTEQASRWIAVADDFEVSADSLATTVGRVGKTLDSGKWEKYGIATRDAGGRARETNDVLLDALDVLSETDNATERARIGNDLFGKSYGNLAPMVGKTREEYEQMLASVEGGQVITDAEAAKAEKMRLAQDRLNDAIGELTLTLGELAVTAAPALDALSTGLHTVLSGYQGLTGSDAQDLSGPLRGFIKTIRDSEGVISGAAPAWEKFKTDAWNALSTIDRVRHKGDEWWNTRRAFSDILKVDPAAADDLLELFDTWVTGAENGSEAMRQAADDSGLTRDRLNELEKAYSDSGAAADDAKLAIQEEAQAMQDAEDAAWRLRDAKRALIDATLGSRGAVRSYQDALDNLTTTTDDAKTSKDEYAEALDRTAEEALRVADAVVAEKKAQFEANGMTYTAAQATDDQVAALSSLAASLAPGSDLRKRLEEYIAQLQTVPREVTTNVSARTRSGATPRNAVEYRAKGGPVQAGAAYVVGENGPEVLQMGSSGGTVIPNNKLGGGDTYNITVNAHPTNNVAELGHVLVDAVKAAARQGAANPWG